jgi:putative transcription factor
MMGTCEMCGNETTLVKARIEGAVLDVCEECARFGEIIARPRKVDLTPLPKQQQLPQVPKRKEIIEQIMPDYAEKIKKAREKLGLTQEEFSKKLNERWSVMQKMESGEMKPSIEQARKLEKALKIELVEQFGEEGEIPLGEAGRKEAGFTLGDFIKKKK